MKKSIFLFITLILILSINCTSNIIYAEENVEEKNEENAEDTDKEKQEILALIYDCLDDIDVKIKNIDKKMDNTKEQEEFKYYPAIRLNIDTPMFGVTSLIENRLRVKKDISTSDVANKYSIRDIVKDRIIKLPDSLLGSIVISTKEYNINLDMDSPQLKLTLIKCIQYLSQVNSVEEFIDTQVNNIFIDYIADSKKDKIRDVKGRTNNDLENLVDISDKINILRLLGNTVDDYSNQYTSIRDELYNIDKSSKNALMKDEEVNELVKKSLSTEAKVLDLQTNITKDYDQKIKDIDYEKTLQNLAKDYEKRIKTMKDYIDKSVSETRNEKDGIEEIKTDTNYEVTSKSTLESLQIALKNVNTRLEEYKKQLEEANKEENKEENENSEVSENSETQENEENSEEKQKEEEDKLIQENINKINTLYIEYKDVLSKEYKFYTNNINMLLRDSNTKMSYIIAELTSNIEVSNEIFNYTKYIYIDLPDNYTNYINRSNLNSMIEMDNLIKLLQVELNKLSQINNRITDMYNKVIAEIMKS